MGIIERSGLLLSLQGICVPHSALWF